MNEKQQIIYDLAVTLFGDKLLEKQEVVVKVIKNTPEIEFIPTEELDEAFTRNLLNDIVFDLKADNLFTKYIIPPFSVLDTRNTAWLSRRRLWDEYLGSSLVGRAGGLTYGTRVDKDFRVVKPVRENDNGTSQFDALLCELIYKWFGFNGCSVLDPFAGGHTRGVVATKLDYDYTGFDLNTEQLEANFKRANELDLPVKWINEDSLNLDKYIKPDSIDLLFTCPPYGDLEKYTDNPADLSNMDYTDFKKAYFEIIKKGLTALKEDRFAVFVVGDFRDAQGFYRGFVADTIEAFKVNGVGLYNEMILLNSLGTAPMRANQNMVYRKMVKVHQNILVFYKGNPRYIKDRYNFIDQNLPIKQLKQESLF